MAASGVDADRSDETSKKAGKIEYPLHVEYCGVCTLPPEVHNIIKVVFATIKISAFLQYCEYGPDPAKCYEWMKEHLPEHYAKLVGGGKNIHA